MNVLRAHVLPVNPEKKTETGGPIKPMDSKICYGSYCMRAEVNKYDERKNLIDSYYGYSDDMERIVKETEDACDIRCRNTEYCGPTKIMFIKDVPNCNGLITENNSKIIQYRHKF